LLKGIRKRVADQRFLDLLWKFIKAGCVDRVCIVPQAKVFLKAV